MAKRRSSSGDEVSLFPFLSILACLIGALIMIIVVMCVSQAKQGDGRTKAEVELAKSYQQMLRELKIREDYAKLLEELKRRLAALQQDQKEKEDRLAKLRKLMTSSKDIQEQNKAMCQALL